jgi:hypothetical protein
VAPASARNSLYNENAVGNFLRMLHYQGKELTAENVRKAMADYTALFGDALPLMPVHREGVQKVLAGGVKPMDVLTQNLTDSYKIPTYSVQTTGNFAHSWVGDVHEAAGETLG